MEENFIFEFNEVKVRKAKHGCRCKVCDNALTSDDDIVYLKSFRLSAQPFHICIDCWRKINGLVEQYKNTD